MGVPMFTQNSLIGFINLDSRTPGAFDNAEQAALVQIFANQAAIAIDKTQLFKNLQLSNYELYLAYDTTLEGWGKALELRDKETQGHTQRVTDLTLKLARQMGIPESDLIHVRRGVLMHDIGKMGIPDSILHKQGPLTKAEMAEMRKHTQYAYDLIYPIVYLRPAIDIAFNHHEWWDGNGYPQKLKGEEIPLSARIFAIVDVWDALLSDRPYRKAWSRKKVIQYIKDLSGKQFDPKIVKEFFKLIESEEGIEKKKEVKRHNKKG
jgi:HD-GYP domain-containing protein (c-di-GMP phosphodiesterase class II)